MKMIKPASRYMIPRRWYGRMMMFMLLMLITIATNAQGIAVEKFDVAPVLSADFATVTLKTAADNAIIYIDGTSTGTSSQQLLCEALYIMKLKTLWSPCL